MAAFGEAVMVGLRNLSRGVGKMLGAMLGEPELLVISSRSDTDL